MANQQGWSQQTPAIRALLQTAARLAPRSTGTGAKRRKSKSKRKSAVSKVKAAVRKVKKVKKRLVKGSKAAKAYMAKIRKMRK